MNVDIQTAFPSRRAPTVAASTTNYALVAAKNGHGVVLKRSGHEISAYLSEIGTEDILDLGLDDAPDGLSIWEGVVVYFDEDDSSMDGIFRPLTQAEWHALATDQPLFP